MENIFNRATYRRENLGNLRSRNSAIRVAIRGVRSPVQTNKELNKTNNGERKRGWFSHQKAAATKSRLNLGENETRKVLRSDASFAPSAEKGKLYSRETYEVAISRERW